jgi:nucleotide-binding universal stress UspA family protein
VRPPGTIVSLARRGSLYRVPDGPVRQRGYSRVGDVRLLRTGRAGVRVVQDEEVLEAVVTEPAQQRIVVGVKRSAASLAALRWAGAEARLRRVTLHVVHAWEPAARPASYAILGDSPASGQERLRAQDDLAAIMRAAFGAEVPAGVTVEVTEGMAERLLVHRSRDACLLVLGATADAGVTGRPAGPVIRACMRSARCPLVIITAPAGARPPLVSAPVAVS